MKSIENMIPWTVLGSALSQNFSEFLRLAGYMKVFHLSINLFLSGFYFKNINERGLNSFIISEYCHIRLWKMRKIDAKIHIIWRGQFTFISGQIFIAYELQTSETEFWSRIVILTAIFVCSALFGYWVHMAIQLEKARFLVHLNESIELIDFNYTRYVMNKDNITDAQFNEISQGPDHLKK